MGHQSTLAHDLDELASALESLDLKGRGGSYEAMSTGRDRLVRSIRTYSIPRLSSDPGPLIVAFAGPTGSGKSTLINSLAGREFSETGPLRPTTTWPIVLAGSQHVPELGRISGIECEVIGGAAPILSSIALVDTPDLDSTSIENRAKAEILIDNADLVVFVTSALRYADLVPWEVLRRASSRGAPVINVINRLGAGSSGAVTDFRSRLSEEGLDADVVRVPEHHIQPDRHRLPGVAVRQLQRRIIASTNEIVEDRRDVVDRVVRSTATQVLVLADELESRLEIAGEQARSRRETLEDAARRLDLGSVFEGLSPGDPPTRTVAGWIWPWRNRVSEDAWQQITHAIGRRMVALIESDVRQALAGGPSSAEISPRIAEELRSRASSLADEWLNRVEGLTDGRFGGRLASLVLAHSAVTGRRTSAFDHLFEHVSPLDSARRDLIGSIEDLYESIEAQIGGQARAHLGHDEPERLRKLAAAVSARSHFADA